MKTHKMKIKKKNLLAACALLALAGCGTMNTVVQHEFEVRKDLARVGTHCGSIPRMYSGVAYDFCRLYAEPAPQATWKSGKDEPWIVGDFFLSGFFDTALLPYTAYKQYTEGNIEIYQPQSLYPTR